MEPCLPRFRRTQQFSSQVPDLIKIVQKRVWFSLVVSSYRTLLFRELLQTGVLLASECVALCCCGKEIPSSTPFDMPLLLRGIASQNYQTNAATSTWGPMEGTSLAADSDTNLLEPRRDVYNGQVSLRPVYK